MGRFVKEIEYNDDIENNHYNKNNLNKNCSFKKGYLMAIYSSEIRKEKIQSIIRDEQPVKTGEKMFGGTPQNVYAIPIEYLSYYPNNSRFCAEAKTFEAENNRKLDISREDDFNIVEDYIWNLSKAENQRTIESLLKNTQQKPGIITKDGVVISGNRRLRMLNEIRRHPERYQAAYPDTFQKLAKFEALVINEDNLSPERLIELEVNSQFGEDAKVEYDSIQKYIAAYDQHVNFGFDEVRIANNYNKKPGDIKKWLEIYELMTEYLEYTGQFNHFTALKELEDPFINLNAKLKQLRSYSTSKVKWAYESYDIEQLKFIFFDNLFARDAVGQEKRYRDILAYFDNETTWKAIADPKGEQVVPVDSLESVNDYAKKYPDLPVDKVVAKRRSDFAEKNKEALETAYTDASYKKLEIEQKTEPIDKLKRAEESLIEATAYLSHVFASDASGLSIEEVKAITRRIHEKVEVLNGLVLRNTKSE